MRDPLPLALLKRGVAAIWTLEHGLQRALSRALGRSRYRLGGACGGCARCCERPTIRARALFFLPRLRALFLAWQQHINGFQLERADRAGRVFVFRCTHLDPVTRRCDSYRSRPFMCRDYPRLLLDQPWPELFPECGFRPQLRDPERARAALAALPEAQRAALARRLFLD